jgi:hypothetical protein
MKKNAVKKRRNYSQAAQAELREKLVKLKERAVRPAARRMIELSIKGLDAGVEPMTAEEISEYLGRNR